MKHYDKGKILNGTLEQFSVNGVGTPYLDLCRCCFFYIILDDKGGLNRACDFWSPFLNSYRASYSDAVRVASRKLS